MKQLLLLITLFTQTVFAQHEFDNWYFGNNTGVSFVSGTPVNVTGGMLTTNEGCSSISDGVGNLLFYTDGQTVYNGIHAIMPNGTGLLGNYSSTQSALIVSDPANSNQYYIFTTDGFLGVNGLRYSIVDMTLQGGLGDVTAIKNVQLLTPCDEKLTGIRNAAGTGFWIVTHAPSNTSNSYYSYPVTTTGVGVPVISSVGPLFTSADSFIGCMKISPDGTHIARTMYDSYAGEIADFDNNTGMVSNPSTYTAPAADVMYGVEFSSTGHVLYMMSGDYTPSKLFQFDMQAGTTAAIAATGTVLDVDASQRSGAIQIASDNKIYVSHSGTLSLGIINDPDVVGLGCNYVQNGFALLTNTNIGLPNAISGLTPLPPIAIFSSPNHLCPGTCTDFVNHSVHGTTYLWTFAGANPGTSTDVNPTSICYNTPGTYSVSLIASNSVGTDTLTLNNYITVYPYPPPQGIAQNGDTLFANQGSDSYQWYYSGTIIPGATDYFYVATQSGDFNVVCTDANGCEVEAVIFSVIAVAPSLAPYSEALEIFPNPALEKLTISNALFRDKEVAIKILDMIGEIVLAVQSKNRNQKTEMSVDVSALSKGIYWIEMVSEGKSFRAKFIKQ